MTVHTYSNHVKALNAESLYNQQNTARVSPRCVLYVGRMDNSNLTVLLIPPLALIAVGIVPIIPSILTINTECIARFLTEYCLLPITHAEDAKNRPQTYSTRMVLDMTSAASAKRSYPLPDSYASIS